jgi:ankyrin repeat protein
VVGNLQRIRAVVKHHVAQADETRTGQFLAASAKGEGDRVKLLLQQGYNPNTCDYDKKTALMLAAAHGHTVRRAAGGGGCAGGQVACLMLL